jgi:hypothetical protein
MDHLPTVLALQLLLLLVWVVAAAAAASSIASWRGQPPRCEAGESRRLPTLDSATAVAAALAHSALQLATKPLPNSAAVLATPRDRHVLPGLLLLPLPLLARQVS